MDGKLGEWGTVGACIIVSSLLGCSEAAGRATSENSITLLSFVQQMGLAVLSELLAGRAQCALALPALA